MELLAEVSLGLAFLCAIVIAVDEMRRPQKMWIMNIVWPVTALYLSVLGLWGYFRLGRGPKRDAAAAGEMHPHEAMAGANANPTAAQVALATSHCGAGCVIGDILSEYTVSALGLTLFGMTLWANYVADFIAAWTLGIVFQYFTIKPMRNLTPWQGLVGAVKADTLSIAAFQVGMYGWMAIVFFVLYPEPHLHPSKPLYWMMMQIAMIFGFATSYPMNRWLILWGVKEAMG